MANTTSGTVTFDKTFAVDEIIEESLRANWLTVCFRISVKNSTKILEHSFSRMGQ